MTKAQEANHNFKNGDYELFDENNNCIYYEESNGYWEKSTFDDNRNLVLFLTSEG